MITFDFAVDQYILCAMNGVERAHESFFNIIEAIFHQFITKNRSYFNNHTFIDHQINKRSLKDWKLCRHNHGHHGKYDNSISDIVDMMEMNDIPIHYYKKTRGVDLCPQDDTGDDSDLHLLCSSLHICMIDWCDEKFNFWPTNISLSPAEQKLLEDEVVKRGFKRFTQMGLVPYYMALRMRKKYRSAPCPYDSVHSLALPYAYQWTNQCEHMYSESGLGKHVDRMIYIIDSRIEPPSEKDLNQFEIWKKDKWYHVSEKPFDDTMAESRKVMGLKKYGLYWYVPFALHTSIIKKGCIDATFLQGLNNNKWVVISSFVQNGLT